MNTHVVFSAPAGASTASHWHAHLDLRFARTAAGTRLVESRHEGPLYVQRPFYPEGKDLAHVYLLHPPGGIVSGDRLQVRLQLERGTQVLCTTPGAGRLYRARADQRLQEQLNHLRVAPDASLEWFPQETLVFPGAFASLDTRIDLAEGARFAGWEITVLGLPANGLAFDSGQLRQHLRLDMAGKPMLIEQLFLEHGNPALRLAAAGLASHPVNGIFVCGPFDAAALDKLELGALQARMSSHSKTQTGITRLGAFVVARFLGDCAQAARAYFLECWEILRPLLLQRPACRPAIWST